MGDMFKLYIIYSKLGLADILGKICSYASSPEEVSSIRKDFTRNSKTGEYIRSNRRFIIVHDSVFEKLKTDGYNSEDGKDFFITQYEIRESNRAPNDCVMHYYFPNHQENKLEMIKKIEHMSNMGLFSVNDYVVHDGVIEFSPRVNDYIRIIVKIVLDTIECRVSWCRKKAFGTITRVFTD